MSAQLRLIRGDHKVNIWSMNHRYRAKVAYPNGGFVTHITYIGSWLGWKTIHPESTPKTWSCVDK